MRKALFIIALLSLTTFGQDKSIPLTAAEQQQWQTLAQREKAGADAINQASLDLVNVPVGADSQTVHAHYQSAWLALQLVRSQRGEWLARLQASKKCDACTIGEDGKSLVPPTVAAPARPGATKK
jgi:hypothetical protein